MVLMKEEKQKKLFPLKLNKRKISARLFLLNLFSAESLKFIFLGAAMEYLLSSFICFNLICAVVGNNQDNYFY